MRDWTEDQIKEQQKERPNEQAKNQLELFLIRHGETASNRERRYLGRTQEPLSREGRARLFELKQEGIYPEAGIVFTSPMQRCLETAGILYPGKMPIVIPEWREIDFGDFEGKNAGELQGDPRYQAWIDSGGTLPFPGGESREEFIRRCCIGLDKMLDMLRNMEIGFQNPAASYKQVAGGSGKVCAVVHGGTIMALLSKFGGGEYFDYQVPCGRGYQCILRYDRSGGPMDGPKAGRTVSVSRIERIQRFIS